MEETGTSLYGLLAEFDTPEDLLAASRRTYGAGYRRIDAFSPLPIHGLAEAIGHGPTRLPFLVLAMGLLGAWMGYSLQYFVSVIDYPLNVGGRPFHSWPSFIPVTFELSVLFAAFGAAGGMLIANRLPMPYHPLFHVDQFARASQDGFFLAIEAEDSQFDLEATRRFLESLHPREVFRVEP